MIRLAGLLVAAVAACAPATPPPGRSLAPGAAAPPPQPAAAPLPRFFVHGTGELRLHHAHRPDVLDVRYRHPDGRYDPDALAAIRHFFRSRSDDREGPVALRLVELLAHVQARYRPARMTLVSGYRSPTHNEGLRAAGALAARASLHTQGLAADVALAGVDLRRVWIDLREERVGGVGYYRRDNFLHLDAGPPRFWEETTSRVTEDLSAGNARLFARTDFDRYPRLEGAEIDLHNVTALPLALRREARAGTARLTLDAEPPGAAEARGPCLVFTAPAERYRLRVRAVDGSLPPGRLLPLTLPTCQPRPGRTPPEVPANPVEIAG